MSTWSSDLLSNSAIPTILISSKCDNNRKAWQIDQRMIERTCSTISGIELFQTSASSPETHKRCVSIVLRKVLSARHGESLNLYFIFPSLFTITLLKFLSRYSLYVHFKVRSRKPALHGFSKEEKLIFAEYC